MRQRQNFVLPSVSQTYAGENAGKYIAAALLSAKTLDQEAVTIMPNVKYKSAIQKIMYLVLFKMHLVISLHLVQYP